MKFLLCCFPGHRTCEDGYYLTFLLYHMGENPWRKWSEQMRVFDAGICSNTKVTALTYFESNTGVSITPLFDRVLVSKVYGSSIILNGTRFGPRVYNEGRKSVRCYKSSSSSMPSVVGEREDIRFSQELIDKSPRLRCYAYGYEKEDGEIIAKHFNS